MFLYKVNGYIKNVSICFSTHFNIVYFFVYILILLLLIFFGFFFLWRLLGYVIFSKIFTISIIFFATFQLQYLQKKFGLHYCAERDFIEHFYRNFF